MTTLYSLSDNYNDSLFSKFFLLSDFFSPRFILLLLFLFILFSVILIGNFPQVFGDLYLDVRRKEHWALFANAGLLMPCGQMGL